MASLDFEGIRTRHPVTATAKRLGLELRRSGQRMVMLCPFHADRNPSATLYPDGGGYCYTCHNHFDSIDLVRRVLHLGFREACVWLDGPDGSPPPVSPASRCSKAQKSLRRPPLGEVAQLWMESRRASEDDGLAAWLESFRLCPRLIGDLDLVRALPRKIPCPSWAGGKRPWSRTEWRALFPVYSSSGEMAGLRARWLGASPPPSKQPKTLAMNGCSTKGLVLADAPAVRLLQEGPSGADSSSESIKPILVITEGERDYAVMAHEMMEKSHVAVLGITSGAWDETIASRIPKEWTVEIYTDHDDAGHAYAKKIRQSLPHHEVTRG